MQKASALGAPASGIPAEAGEGEERGWRGERGCSGKDGRRVWAPESRVGWRTGRERPDAHLWVTLGSHRATEEMELQLQHQSFRWIFRVDFL